MEQSKFTRFFPPFIAGVSVLCLLGLRLFFAAGFDHPGHGDFAHYYNLAVNLYEGRGLVVDYVWDYLRIYDSITHVPLYWMPLASVSMALFFHAAGASVRAGILLSVIVLALLVAVVGFISRREHPGGGATRHLGAALLIAGLPVIFSYSLITDAVIYNTLWITAGIFLLGVFVEKQRPVFLYGFVFFAVLVYYSRGDGLVLAGTAAASFLLVFFRVGRDRKKLLFHAAAALFFYFLLIHPYSIITESAGDNSSDGVGMLSLVFATSYNDLFVYGAVERLNLENWLAEGVSSALRIRLRAAVDFIAYLLKISLGTILLAPFFVFLAIKRPEGRSFYLPMMLQGLFLFGAYTILLPLLGMGGSFNKSIIALFPLWSLAVYSEAARLAAHLSGKTGPGRETVRKYAAGSGILLYVLVMVFFVGLGVERGFEMLGENEKIDNHWGQLAGVLHDGTPVICPEPWECYFSTGYPSLITPGPDWESVFVAAEIYDVFHVVLEKRSPGDRSRKFKKLVENIPGFLETVYESESLKIVEIPEEMRSNLP